LLWLGLLLGLAAGTVRPSPAGELGVLRTADGCRLAIASPEGRVCACHELPADLRLLVGLPISLERSTPDDLERLPGIGPERAARIHAERARRPFRSVADLERVPGIGAATVKRLASRVFVGPTDPACSGDAEHGLRYGSDDRGPGAPRGVRREEKGSGKAARDGTQWFGREPRAHGRTGDVIFIASHLARTRMN
jgi:hypothetical protein